MADAPRVTATPSMLEAMAFNLCSLHDFDVAFVRENERFATAVITEYVRSGSAVPAPTCQKCGGEIAGWLCQQCPAEFRENDSGVLVLDSEEAQDAQPVWIGIDAAADAPQEFKDWAARFRPSCHTPDELRAAAKALPGATYQKSERITLTASGDETCAELKQHMASVLPPEFRFAGGLDRIRKGDPVLGTNRLHERDQQAHAAFVAHHPRKPLGHVQAEPTGGA